MFSVELLWEYYVSFWSGQLCDEAAHHKPRVSSKLVYPQGVEHSATDEIRPRHDNLFKALHAGFMKTLWNGSLNDTMSGLRGACKTRDNC
jgi:hypothetical protein